MIDLSQLDELSHCGWYEDWYSTEMAEVVLEVIAEFNDDELRIFISATAIYAANFLNPN